MIQEGMLWYDDSPTRSVSEKVERAAARYEKKYGHKPDVCYVHPEHLKEGEVSVVEGVKVLPSKSVLRYHFWLGVEAESGKKRKVAF